MKPKWKGENINENKRKIEKSVFLHSFFWKKKRFYKISRRKRILFLWNNGATKIKKRKKNLEWKGNCTRLYIFSFHFIYQNKSCNLLFDVSSPFSVVFSSFFSSLDFLLHWFLFFMGNQIEKTGVDGGNMVIFYFIFWHRVL
jgi:hypothetical protein